MSSIETYLQYIASKVWARDVRTAIVNAIRQCYDDVHNPTLNTEALQAAIQAKIDAGQMAALTIGDRTITAAKLALGVIPTPDATLSQSGVPADAKKTGDEISTLQADLEAQGEVSVRYDEQQSTGDNEKRQALLNIGSIDLMYEVNQALNDRYVQMLDDFEMCLGLLANAEFLTDNISKFSEVSRMFNKIENQYAVSFGVSFSFPAREASPVFKGIAISQTTRNNRGAIFSLFGATHALKDENGNNTNYYPIQIPAKATLVYSNNAREMGLAICYHVLKYDETLGDYIRATSSSFHFGNPKNDGAYIFDISDYNDGTYYLVCGIGTANSESAVANRNIEDIYVGQKTRASMTNNVLTYDQIKGTNITIV